MYTDSARGRWVNNLQSDYINSGYRGTEWRWTGRPKLTRTQERADATAHAELIALQEAAKVFGGAQGCAAAHEWVDN